MAPNEEAKHCDRQTRERDKLVTEDVLAREVCYQLADHSHRRENHDVDSRMRVEPEQVLEQNGIATKSRIEDADTGQTLKSQ